jgi:hypothetical protein
MKRDIWRKPLVSLSPFVRFIPNPEVDVNAILPNQGMQATAYSLRFALASRRA